MLRPNTLKITFGPPGDERSRTPLLSQSHQDISHIACLSLSELALEEKATMDGFDTMAMPSYLHSPLSLDNVTTDDYLGVLQPLGIADHVGTYGHGDYGG